MTNPPNDHHPEPGTYLSGNALVLMRATWLALVVLMFGTFLAALPVRWAQLLTITPTGDTALVALAPVEAAFLEQHGISMTGYALYFVALETCFFIIFAILGCALFIRKSTEYLGAFASMALIAFGMLVPATARALDTPASSWEFFVHLIENIGWISFTLCFYIFPDGRFIPRVTRLLPLAFIGWAILWLCFPFANPFNWQIAPALLAFLGLFASGAFAQVYRYKFAATRVQRLQTRWVVFAFILATLGILIFAAPLALIPATQTPSPARVLYHMLGIPFFAACLLLIPLALVFAILRYRLFDIDVLIRRTLIYGLATGVLLTVYVALVILLQLVLQFITGQNSDLAIIVSTLSIAALSNPLRRRVQDLIDRRFYQHKYDAQKILAAFAATVRDETDLQKLAEKLLVVVDETMQPTNVSLWLTSPRHPSPSRRADGREVS